MSQAFKLFAEEWLKRYLYDQPHGPANALGVATALDLPVQQGGGGVAAFGSVVDYMDSGDEQLLDVLHYTVLVIERGDVTFRPPSPWEVLERHLAFAGSVWSATEHGLVNRAEQTAVDAMTTATRPADKASAHLVEAWRKAYDRDGDPSDAWDHAIKAVEEILLPIVIPAQDQAKIGQVLGELGSKGQQWDVGLQFNADAPPRTPPVEPVEALVGMLRLLYPNPDRHSGASHRSPTAEEARVVVQLAVSVVQWAREGIISKRT
ncbi:hypothetical protein [Kribbella antiqua]|uniref:hypothetical protein n=1 Tax=Kribbella antiqua TaxID=2512217 RepID=UPI001A7ED549|nr:hypothetical protein [Kribbella antiqua]